MHPEPDHGLAAIAPGANRGAVNRLLCCLATRPGIVPCLCPSTAQGLGPITSPVGVAANDHRRRNSELEGYLTPAQPVSTRHSRRTRKLPAERRLGYTAH